MRHQDSQQEHESLKRFRLWLCTLFLLVNFCTLNSVAANTVAVDSVSATSTSSFLNAPPPIQLLTPTDDHDNKATAALDIQGILNLDKEMWQPYPEEHINLGFVDHPIWIKIQLPDTLIPDTYLLEFANNKISKIDIYIVNRFSNNQAAIPHMQLLESTPLSQRFISQSNYIFPITLTPGQHSTLYINVGNTYPLKLPIYFWDQESFTEKTNNQTFFNGIYFGSVLIMALYNLCLFFFVKDRSYANYVIFIITLALFVALDKGLAIQYLWYDTPELNHRFYTLAISLGALSSVRFTMSFLSLRENAPKISRGLELLSLCWLALIITSISSGNPIILGLVFLLLLPGGTALFIAGVYMWKKGMPEASFYTIAWITLVHAVLGYSASFLGFIPYSAWLDNLIQATNILEAALLSLGLAYRINTLNRDKQKAFTSDQAKSDLLATMSHEIRTPMNGILGMTQLLKDTELSPQQNHYLKTILGSGQTLLTILNDILDHSKIEAGKLEIESIPFNIRQTLDETASIFSTRAADKMLYFNIYMGPTVPLAIDGDPTRIRQVLTNLLSNAFKFTDEGSVIVNVTLQKSDSNNVPSLLIEVEDQGIGIPENKLNKLFKSFSQTDTSTSRQYGGTGLGLSISKRLIELMGGEIGVRSESGKGSTFWFSIPVVNEQLYVLPPDPILIKKLSSLNTLIISHTPRFTAMLEQHAVVWNMHFSHAETISELRKLANETNKNFHYILIELTSQLHNTNEITRFISQTESLQHAQLIISAPAGTSDSRIDTDQLEKVPWIIDQPFSINRAFYLIYNSQIQSTQKKPIIDINRPFEGRHGLVVDDNSVNRQVALAFLKKLGVDAVAVASGQEAIDFICNDTAKSNSTLDVVLMDCEMPGINGFQATRSIRIWEQNNNLPALPIIALSAHAMESHKSACSDAGMNDFVAKPVVFDSLRKTLGEYIK